VDIAENNPNLGPLCNDAQRRKVESYVGIGRSEAKLRLGGDAPQLSGYFMNPTIFTNVAPDARIAQEEVFGPFVSVIAARNFEEGLTITNNTVYGLTGALFSTDRNRIATARSDFHVGNLYFNRKCTGALAGVQPFGGFNLSGTDTKTGGPDYLMQFMQMKSIAERL
jgi:1-pyrroline-5-carboxylate dehydrogenase